MKTVCVYHSIDLDGWMSAAIVKHWFIETNKPNNYIISNTETARGGKPYNPNSLDFIGYNYGDPIPDLSEYDKVIMCDVSFPKEDMSKLWHNLDIELIWIDHHISAIKDNDDLIYKGLKDTKFAACELTWQYFFPNQPMPEIVRLLGRYDCFGHKGTDEEQKVLAFQYCARQEIWNYELAYNKLISNIDIDEWLIKGYAIYNYLCTEAKQVYKNGFEIILKEPKSKDGDNKPRKFIAINKERFNPINFGIDYHKDGYNGCACFWYNGQTNLWHFSLYNDNGHVDCSQIAKQYGGGGHKGASGFTVKNINEII